MSYVERYHEWLENPYFNNGVKEELHQIRDDEAEIEERFYKELEFGTGGMRGVLGAGTNRMNIYTIRKATQGLANVIKQEGGQAKGVVIAYDSRRYSTEFALETAKCLVANGIKTYLFTTLRPTPLLSFAVRELKCIAGVVITASHNPAQYNGYKVYWEDGAQITPPQDKAIIQAVNAIVDYKEPLTTEADKAVKSGRLCYLGEEVDKRYYQHLKKEVQQKELLVRSGKDLKIVYTPLHGAGMRPVTQILEELGFTNVHVVAEQTQPDGAFPTVASPNPENESAFHLALALAKEVDADLVLATDPDADRLGAYVKGNVTGNDKGDDKGDDAKTYIALTGNMSAALILAYLLEQRKEKGTAPSNGALVTTIVSGRLGKAIAKDYGLEIFETLTGFKYIGQKIREFEESGTYRYQFGYEESYGCLVGTYARDKDAVSAAAMLCEAALYYKKQGSSLAKQLQGLFQKYGYYYEDLGTALLTGKEGVVKIESIMAKIRKQPPVVIAGKKVQRVFDYQQCEKTGLPKSNVLYFELENDSWCCVRPSGTEPKIKFYIGVKGTSEENAKEQGQELLQTVMTWVK